MVDTFPDSSPEAELAAVYCLYSALARELDPVFGLGGKLLYAGELRVDGFRLVRASNIAGAASLSVSADTQRQKQAVREGVVDFLVTSLDEALRILKNEIRKRQGVAVGIALSPELVESEMLDRGVLPDLLFPGAHFDEWTRRGVEMVVAAAIPPGKAFLAVPLPPPLARSAAEIDQFILGLLPAQDGAGRRWLTVSPRYLDPRLRNFRSFLCDADAAATLLDQLDQKIEAWRASRRS